MKQEDAIYFAGLMEDYLQIPAMYCELIEKKLMFGEYQEVIDFIIKRRKDLEYE